MCGTSYSDYNTYMYTYRRACNTCVRHITIINVVYSGVRYRVYVSS